MAPVGRNGRDGCAARPLHIEQTSPVQPGFARVAPEVIGAWPMDWSEIVDAVAKCLELLAAVRVWRTGPSGR